MEINHTNIDGVLSFSLLDVESVLKQERQAFLLDDHILREYPGNLRMKNKNIHSDSLINLMQWLHKAYSLITALAIKEYVKQCMKRVQKRAYSTSHRIEIAYKSKLKFRCKQPGQARGQSKGVGRRSVLFFGGRGPTLRGIVPCKEIPLLMQLC